MRTLAPMILIFLAWSPLAVLPDSSAAQEVSDPAGGMQRSLAPVPESIATYHTGWGVLTSDGELTGQVVTLNGDGSTTPQSGVEVVIEGESRVLGRAMTDQDGAYRIGGLEPGVYYLIARGPGVYASHALQLVAGNGQVPMDIYASQMDPAKGEGLLRELWSPNPHPREAVFGELVASPEELRQSHEYVLTSGGVHGQLAFPYRSADYAGHIVRAYQKGKLVAAARVDEYARFFLPIRSSGVTDLVVGGAGFAHVSAIYLIAPEVVTAVPRRRSTMVSFHALDVNQGGRTLIVPVRPSPIIPSDRATDEGPIAGVGPLGPMGGTPYAPTSGGGFGGGGAAGGGGAGGLGAILGAAGLAVGAAALSDDDDGFNVNLSTGIGP